MTMQWQKPSEALTSVFDAALPAHPGIERKKMFGLPAVFVNGNMCAGVWHTGVMLRLPEERRRAIVAAGEGEPFVPMGRPMREYVLITAPAVEDRELVSRWLVEAVTFVAAMPVKTPKPRRAKKAS
jgi:TfoX/Sxy family transcriptional regulator of competence genes